MYYCELEAENGEYIYTRDDMQYYWTNQGEEYYNSDFSNQFLTLQTCVENHDELLEIVLCKEVGRYKFE